MRTSRDVMGGMPIDTRRLRLASIAGAIAAIAACTPIQPHSPTPSALPTTSPTPSSSPLSSPSRSSSPSGATGYAVDCGPLVSDACRAEAERIVANTNRLYPTKVVVAVKITGADGDYELTFSDGTGIAAEVN